MKIIAPKFMDLHTIPECFIDTKLAKSLVPPESKRYNHQKGCSTVVKLMKTKFNNDFALGIIDRDKRELDYARMFTLISKVENRLELYKYKNHYLIFICPAMEKWIIACAEDAGLKLNDYNLPDNFVELSYLTKTAKSENEDPHSKDFDKLFRDLKNSNVPTIEVYKFWISYLKAHPYNADLEFIKSETNRILDL